MLITKHLARQLLLTVSLLSAPLLCLPSWAATPIRATHTNSVSGTIDGLHGVRATVTLGNDRYLRTTTVDANGYYEFNQVPDGKYFIKAEVNGSDTGPAREVILPYVAPTPKKVSFQASPLPTNKFSYTWTADASRGGSEISASINTPPSIKFLDQTIAAVDASAAAILRDSYNIVLSNEGAVWTQEYASRFMKTMKAIPQILNLNLSTPLKPSKWILTDQAIADDIQVVRSDAGDTITLSTATMVYADPRMVLLDGVKGQFYSKRLHRALLRYVTKNGEDIYAVERILNERFNVTTQIPDYAALVGEDQFQFNAFRGSELLDIISMFEEMPNGYHVVQGLKYLVRRAFGHGIPNCLCAARAVTSAGFIEFTDGAFVDLSFAYHTVLHEKGHFLWAFLFDDKLKSAWATVGGWYPSTADRDGWATTKTTEFVTPYAHQKNPEEDMAESLAAYVLDPALLQSRSPAKFKFIRENVMQGDVYVSSIRDDLKFNVYNLFPDYDFPGKIKRVTITVDGAPEDDKVVTVELEVEHVDGKSDDVAQGYLIMYSGGRTCNELWLYQQIDQPTVLKNSFRLSKYAKGGYWTVDQIRLVDKVGNMRFEGPADFGWKMYVDNPLEDTTPPTYVPHSLTIAPLAPIVVDGHTKQVVRVTYKVEDNNPIPDTELTMDRCCTMSVELMEMNSKMVIAMFGKYDSKTKTLTADFELTEFFASGDYGVIAIYFMDAARNGGHQYFSNSPNDEPLTTIPVHTANPDYDPPEIDLNKITIIANPTNPREPNGETEVEIDFYAKDNKAGIQNLRYYLTDPQGITHEFYFTDKTWEPLFYVGDPNVWRRYTMKTVLPVGSAPGVWGLARILIGDHANNSKTYDFTEILHFSIYR